MRSQLLTVGLSALSGLAACFATWLAATWLAVAIGAQQPAPAPAPAQPEAKAEAPARPARHRGHKPAPNLDHLRTLSHKRHNERLKRLPRATAPSFDARAQGWVGPVKDQ